MNVKLDVTLPIGETDEDCIEILADADGLQINVMVAYLCQRRIKLTKNYLLSIVNHAHPQRKIEVDLFDDTRLD